MIIGPSLALADPTSISVALFDAMPAAERRRNAILEAELRRPRGEPT